MPLDNTRLAEAIKTAISSVLDVQDATQLQDISDAIATAVVNEITANALVTATVSGVTGVGPSGGPLPIVAQPVTGTVS